MLQRDERAATPVIGVVLLVAVTVLLGVTVTVYSTGVSNGIQEPPPRGTFEFTYEPSSDTASYMPDEPEKGSDNLTVVYTGGESIPSDRINVTVRGAKAITQNGNVNATNLDFEPDYAGGGNLFSNVEKVSAGASYTISDVDFRAKDGSDNLGDLRKLDLSDATVRVYWQSESGENSAVIAKWTGEDA